MVSAFSMVRRLCVMMMNCVLCDSARSSSTKRPTFASSSAASTSSSTQIGDGFACSSAKSSATAVSDRSPPESSVSEPSFLPGGCATISMPGRPSSSVSPSSRRAVPPRKKALK